MALALDGSASVSANLAATTQLVTLSTTNSNDLIVVDVASNGSPVVSLTSAHLTFSPLHARAGTDPQDIERWFAVAASPLSSEVITVTVTGSGSFNSTTAYGISGANTASPWDSGGPQTSAASPSDPISITTTNANTMAIATYRMANTGSPTNGTGFTQIAALAGSFAISEFKILSSIQTLSCTLNAGAADAGAGIVDAVVAASGVSDTLGGAMPILMMSRRRRDPVKTLLLPSKYRRRTRGFALAA